MTVPSFFVLISQVLLYKVVNNIVKNLKGVVPFK